MSVSPCAACKVLRRRCTNECIFAPHLPAAGPQEFAHWQNVQKVYGVKQVTEMLKKVDPLQRREATESIIYDANSRVHDPVHGSLGQIRELERDVLQLQREVKVLKERAAAAETSRQ